MATNNGHNMTTSMNAASVIKSSIIIALFALLAACHSSRDNNSELLNIKEFLDSESKEDLSEFEEFDVPPVLVKSEVPEYPEEAKRKKIEGTVLVRIIIDENGFVERAKILKSPYNILDEPTLKAIYKFEFKPATFKGKPVKSVLAIPIRYSL